MSRTVQLTQEEANYLKSSIGKLMNIIDQKEKENQELKKEIYELKGNVVPFDFEIGRLKDKIAIYEKVRENPESSYIGQA